MIDGRDPSGSADESPEYEIDVEEADDDMESVVEEALRALEELESPEVTAARRSGGDREADREGAPGAGGASDAPETEGQVGALQAEVAELRDRSMRTLADFDNYRKRMQRERVEERRYASIDVLRELLEVADNLGRALGSGGSFEDLKTGVEMIHRQLDELLRRHGVVAVEAVGAPFDPMRHEAVTRRETSEVAEPVVEKELARGYMIHDRLLRPAMVAVAVPARGPDSSGNPSPAGGDGE